MAQADQTYDGPLPPRYVRQFPVPDEPQPATGFSALLIVSGLLLSAALASVLFAFDPSHTNFYPFCWFHRTTGWLCPGCGSLRAMHQLLHVHLAQAFQYNALLILALPWAAWRFGRSLAARWQKAAPPRPISGRALVIGLVVLVLFGIARNLPFAHALWLAP